MHCELLINGTFIGGPCDSSVGKTQHYSPYDGHLVGTAAEAGWNEVNSALDSAAEAFQTYRNTPKEDRAKLLRTIAANVRDQQDNLAKLMANEIGKPITQAQAEVTRLHLTFDLAAKLAEQNHTRTIDVTYDPRGKNATCQSTRVPIGPILAIVPYNWPFNLAAHKIAPALAAGNTVVVKTPSMGTLSTLTLAKIIHESGCPDGVINVLNMPSALAQKAALDDRIVMLSFTGSPKVGWMLKEKLPRKRVALELGGDATSVLAPDADITRAVTQLVPASFAYAGQVCISTQHILVHDSIYQDFKEQFITATESAQTGNPLDKSTLCGPVIRTEDADRILDWIEQAESQGATVLTGGQRTNNVIEPCIIENVTREMTLGKEEVFGPVVTLQPYQEDQQAINWINASQFGIHASLFTQDQSRIQTFFNQIEIGGLIINDSPALRFDAMPYGGVKNSGFGREGVANTFHEMTEDKVLLSNG